MPERVAVRLKDVLAGFRDALTNAGVFPAARCPLALSPDHLRDAAPVDQSFAAISFNRFSQRLDSVSTEPVRHEIPAAEGEVTVSLFVRADLDRTGFADALLTTAAVNATDLIERVAGVLSEAELTDGAGGLILMAPVTFLDVQNRSANRPEKDPWRRFDLRFYCLFRWKLA